MRNPHLDIPIPDKDGWCDLKHWRPKTQEEIDDSWSTISIANWSPSADLAQIIPAERKREQDFLNFISRWLEARKKSKKRFSKMRDAYIEFIEVVEGSVEEAKLKMAVKGEGKA